MKEEIKERLREIARDKEKELRHFLYYKYRHFADGDYERYLSAVLMVIKLSAEIDQIYNILSYEGDPGILDSHNITQEETKKWSFRLINDDLKYLWFHFDKYPYGIIDHLSFARLRASVEIALTDECREM